MTKEMIKIHNVETGEVIEREMTIEEIANRTARLDADNSVKAEATAKAEARASALAKLAALGLSADEIAAL